MDNQGHSKYTCQDLEERMNIDRIEIFGHLSTQQNGHPHLPLSPAFHLKSCTMVVQSKKDIPM